MTGIGKTIGRLIAVLVDAGIIERKQAVWILEPLKNTAVDAEPVRHGKWMGTVCSECGASVSFYYDCDYCPCCGARMDEK